MIGDNPPADCQPQSHAVSLGSHERFERRLRIVEADTEHAKGYEPLRSGVSGFEISFARRLNVMLGRRGKVWVDRYHRHDLKTPKETWNGLASEPPE